MLRNKTISILILAISLFIVTFSFGYTTEEQYEKLNIKFHCSGSDLGVDALAAYKFAESAKEASNGNINVTVYPNCQLSGGSMPKAIELFTLGTTFEMAILSNTVAANLDPRFQIQQIPLVFKDYDTYYEKLDSTGGDQIAKLLDAQGIVFLSGMSSGLKQITNSKREIRTAEDVKGLKIRIPGGEIDMRSFRALRADPVALNFGELYTALQQKTVDGQQNSFQTIDSIHLYEVQKYLTVLNWSIDSYFFMANKERWNSFNDSTKTLLREKAIEAAQYGRDLVTNTEEELKKKFKDKGVIISELTPEEVKSFADVWKPVQVYFIDKFGEEECAAWGIEK